MVRPAFFNHLAGETVVVGRAKDAETWKAGPDSTKAVGMFLACRVAGAEPEDLIREHMADEDLLLTGEARYDGSQVVFTGPAGYPFNDLHAAALDPSLGTDHPPAHQQHHNQRGKGRAGALDWRAARQGGLGPHPSGLGLAAVHPG
jgi:hypothetical protein